MDGADAVFNGRDRRVHMRINVAQHHRFPIMAAQMALPAVCGDITGLRRSDDGDNQAYTDGGGDGTRDGHIHGESNLRADNGTDSTDEDAADEHGFHGVGP